jgi:hypothetical protein
MNLRHCLDCHTLTRRGNLIGPSDEWGLGHTGAHTEPTRTEHRRSTTAAGLRRGLARAGALRMIRGGVNNRVAPICWTVTPRPSNWARVWTLR